MLWEEGRPGATGQAARGRSHYRGVGGYLDGYLGRRRITDLDGLLLKLYPREVVADRELAKPTFPVVAGLFEFLEDQALLAPGSDPLSRLLARLDAPRGTFLEALNDASR